MGNILKTCIVAATLALGGCVTDPLPAGGHPPGHRFPAGGHHPNGGPANNGQRIRCESVDGRSRSCAADTRGGVQLVRQLSRTQCVQGRNWGYERDRIWVSGGCGAEFATGRGGNGPGWGNAPGQGPKPGPAGNGKLVRCESSDGRLRQCNIAGGNRGVTLVRQLSRTQCVQGRNWGYERNRIWVNGGCSAEFRVN